MTDRTRISGWDVREDPPRPMEVFVDGHVTPTEALRAAGVQGMYIHGYVTIEHQIVDLPRWHKPKDGDLRPVK